MDRREFLFAIAWFGIVGGIVLLCFTIFFAIALNINNIIAWIVGNPLWFLTYLSIALIIFGILLGSVLDSYYYG